MRVVVNASGFGVYRQLGALQALQDRAVRAEQWHGASSGSIVAALGAAGVGGADAVDAARRLWSATTGLRFWRNIHAVTRGWLYDLIPDNVDTSRARIYGCRVPTLEQEVLDVAGKEDLVAAVLASCHIPYLLMPGAAARYKGAAYVDGGLSRAGIRRIPPRPGDFTFPSQPASASASQILSDGFGEPLVLRWFREGYADAASRLDGASGHAGPDAPPRPPPRPAAPGPAPPIFCMAPIQGFGMPSGATYRPVL